MVFISHQAEVTFPLVCSSRPYQGRVRLGHDSLDAWEPYDRVTRNVGAGPEAKRPGRESMKRRPRIGQLTTGIPFHSSNGDAPTTQVSLKATSCEQSTGSRVGISEVDPLDRKGGPGAQVLMSYSHLTTGSLKGKWIL